MNEFANVPGDDLGKKDKKSGDNDSDVKKEFEKINSTSEMARALGFTQDPKTTHGRDREYSRDFQTAGVFPAEMALYSGDFLDGQYEEVEVGVEFEEPLKLWTKKHSVLSDAFLNWFRENGGDLELVSRIQKLEDAKQKGRFRKDLMRKGGYSSIALVVSQAEKLGYFRDLRSELVTEYHAKKNIAEQTINAFLAEFPEYSLFSNRFGEEKGCFYAAKPSTKGKRVKAMKIEVSPDLKNSGNSIFEFQLGNMRVSDDGNIANFRQQYYPKLPSGEYPTTWFRDELSTTLDKAIASRKEIQDKLGI